MTTKEQADFLRDCGYSGVPEDHEFPGYWNPPDGTGAITTEQAMKRVAQAVRSGRSDAKPFWRTSEWWSLAGAWCVGLGSLGAAVAGLADFLPENVQRAVTTFGGALVGVSTLGYKFARQTSKQLTDEASKEPTP